MGWEVTPFKDMILEPTTREDVVVGYIHVVRESLGKIGVSPPRWIDYPEELRYYLKRNVWLAKATDVAMPDAWPVFVKPVEGKQFDGRLVTEIKDLRGVASQEGDRDVWCSTPIKFVSEWRCFVRYGKVLDARRYKGDYKKHPSYLTVLEAVSEYKSAPAGYALDFGVTDDGDTVLIEANDGYSMGAYGLNPIDYAKMISARWHELVGLEDPCDF